jgi:group II intron reverse transcriptase/maturase
MQMILNLIAAKAKREKKLRFTSLVHLVNAENLKLCYTELKRNKAVGVDAMTVEEYGINLDERLKSLVERMKSKRYQPQPVRRVYIPKPGKEDEKRGLGIPTVEDKLVQIMLKKILESIFEVDFLNCSYGFRPKLNCHTAIKALNDTVMTKLINYVVEVDIRKFFDTVSHKTMMRCLKVRIADPNLLRMVNRFLKAGIIDAGQFTSTEQGAPQGGNLSPLLANIYLHYVLDLWFEKKFKPQAKAQMHLIRYCDDLVVCCESEVDAKTFLESFRTRLTEFELSVSEEKTRIIKFGQREWYLAAKQKRKSVSFNFLGFTHYATKSRRGKWILGHKTSKENFSRKLREIKDWIKAIRNRVKLNDWWPILKAKLKGHFNYFAISGNYRWIYKFRCRVISLALKWINRRSQKKSMTWDKYIQYLQSNPLPEARISFSLYQTK